MGNFVCLNLDSYALHWMASGQAGVPIGLWNDCSPADFHRFIDGFRWCMYNLSIPDPTRYLKDFRGIQGVKINNVVETRSCRIPMFEEVIIPDPDMNPGMDEELYATSRMRVPLLIRYGFLASVINPGSVTDWVMNDLTKILHIGIPPRAFNRAALPLRRYTDVVVYQKNKKPLNLAALRCITDHLASVSDKCGVVVAGKPSDRKCTGTLGQRGFDLTEFTQSLEFDGFEYEQKVNMRWANSALKELQFFAANLVRDLDLDLGLDLDVD